MAKPKIRFKGYTNDWEQRRLGEFIKNVAKKNKENLDLEPYAVTNDRGFIAQRDAHDDFGYMSNVDRTAYNIVPPNSFAYNPARINVGSLGYYAGRENVIVSSLYEVFQTEKNIDDKFLWHWLRSDAFPKWIEKLQEGSVRLYFYYDKLIQCQMMVSTTEEQKKIGEYLDSLDHLITLHQRKCDQAKKLKKYMLQKMFPKNNKSVPEIRFEGFSNDWEQRKVTDLGEIYIGLVTTMTEHYTDKGHLLIRNSDIKDGYFEFGENPIYLDEEFSEQNKSRMHKIGDVITVHTGDIGTSAVIGEYEVNSIGFATIVTRPNQKILDSNYFSTYLNTDTHKQWAISMATGDGRSNYNLKDYTKLVVPIPHIKEQKKIAACIVKLNNFITLHQKKCDQLKNLKKFMLQNMFV